MIRSLFTLSAFVLSPIALAQTTLDITTPTNGVCSYTTGAVTSGTTPGHLQASATAANGAGCATTGGGTGSTALTFGPASPLAASPTSLSSSSGTVNFTFQPLNAVSCTGAITDATGGSFVGSSTFCSTLSACAAPQSFAATFNNTSTTASANYKVTATCKDASGTPLASSVIVPVAAAGTVVPPSACISIPNTAGGVFTQVPASPLQPVVFDGATHAGTLKVDETSHDAVFGAPFPGVVPGQTGKFTLAKTNYISMKFVIPVGYASNLPGFTQAWTINNTNDDAPVSMTISTNCGDFSNPVKPGSTVVAKCIHNRMLGAGKLTWQEVPDSNACVLSAGTYYLNLINADISNVGANGTGSATTYAGSPGTTCGNSCQLPLQTGGPAVPLP